MTEWIGIIVMGFLIAGGIWVLLESIEGRFGWGGVVLVLFAVTVAILAYFGKKSKEQ